MQNKKRDKNAPITDRAEYERLLKQVRRRRKILLIFIIAIISILLIIMFSSGRVLKIFGVKNYYNVMNYFYGGFYVITGIAVAICLIYVCWFLIKICIDFIKDLKNKGK